jgi:hypothetical protein
VARAHAEHLLEVVEHEQDPFAAQPLLEDVGGGPARSLGESDGCGEPRRHEDRLAHRLERDEKDAVRKVVRGVRGDLERQARLARATGSGQGHQPVLAKQPGCLRELALAPDERGQLRRQVVRAGIDRAQRRELQPEALGHHLGQRLRLAQVLEPVAPQAAQRDLGSEIRRCQRPNRVGDHDLAAVRRGRDPRRAIDVQPDEPGRGAGGLPGVQAHAHAHLDAVRPRLGGERALRIDRREHRVLGVVEKHEERVALGALLAAAVAREGRPEQGRVALEDRRVRPLAQLVEKTSRALDVREQERPGRARRGGLPRLSARRGSVRRVLDRRDARGPGGAGQLGGPPSAGRIR